MKQKDNTPKPSDTSRSFVEDNFDLESFLGGQSFAPKKEAPVPKQTASPQIKVPEQTRVPEQRTVPSITSDRSREPIESNPKRQIPVQNMDQTIDMSDTVKQLEMFQMLQAEEKRQDKARKQVALKKQLELREEQEAALREKEISRQRVARQLAFQRQKEQSRNEETLVSKPLIEARNAPKKQPISQDFFKTQKIEFQKPVEKPIPPRRIEREKEFEKTKLYDFKRNLSDRDDKNALSLLQQEQREQQRKNQMQAQRQQEMLERAQSEKDRALEIERQKQDEMLRRRQAEENRTKIEMARQTEMMAERKAEEDKRNAADYQQQLTDRTHEEQRRLEYERGRREQEENARKQQYTQKQRQIEEAGSQANTNNQPVRSMERVPLETRPSETSSMEIQRDDHSIGRAQFRSEAETFFNEPGKNSLTPVETMDGSVKEKKSLFSGFTSKKEPTSKRQVDKKAKQKDRKNPEAMSRPKAGKTEAKEEKELKFYEKPPVSYLFNILCVVLLLLIAYQGYSIWQMFMEQKNIDANVIPVEQDKIEESQSDTGELGKTIHVNIEALQDSFNNKDIVGYVEIPETELKLPVTQREANFFLDHSLEGKKNKAGSIMLNKRNNRDGSDQNMILYGHNAGANKMFHTITLYKEEGFLNDHRLITYTNYYTEEMYEVFAFYQIDASDEAAYNQVNVGADELYTFDAFIAEITELSLHETTMTFDENDSFITLTTTVKPLAEDYNKESDTLDLLFVVHAKKIKQ